MKFHSLFLALLSLFAPQLFAQNVFLKSGIVHPEKNITEQVVDSFNQSAERFNKQAFAVMQFEHLPTIEERKALAANGIELLDYLPQNSYTVSIKGNLSSTALQSINAKAIFQLSPQQKMQEYFTKNIIPAWAVQVAGTVDVWISFYPTLDADLVIQKLKELNVDVLSVEHAAYRVLSLRIAANRINEIASLPFVEYVQPAPPKDQPLNYNSRTASRATILNTSIANGGRGLNGEGIFIGHGDNADLQDHADFNGRLINRNASPFNAHGVHTAGTLAGAGNINELYRGYAPKASIISQSFSGIIDNAATYVQDYGMVITNNSYGDIIECEYNGVYDLYSRILDQQAFDLPNLLHVFSAGNSGSSTCPPYPSGFHTVLGTYQTAKNVVTVGATSDSGLVAGFSSRGPVRDGRLKPEITAQGQQVISSWPVNIYLVNNGTSMSAPAVSGGLALLYQRYRQLNANNPKNGLMKAILCNGAMDRGVAGPDFTYGFGWMNLLRSVEMIEGNHYFTGNSVNGGNTTHSISVPSNTAQLKVMLYWNDLPASIISTKNLVNDLDLEVVDPSGAIVLPKILDTAITNLNNAAVNGADHVNNIEQVVINNPAAGSYTIRVKGTTVTNAQQEYFIAYDPVPVQLKITEPTGGEALVPGETAKISWEANGLTGTCNVEFSSDGGANWSTIATNIDVNRVVYSWTVPSVATNNALVRLTKNTTGETSLSNAFTIVGQPTISLSSIQCEDYIAINWTLVAGATDYEVMKLNGDEMKPVAITTNTSYTFSGLSKDSSYFVSVRARINGKAGRRSIAISRQPNSGNCAGTISDNDLKLDAILSPRSGRKFTSTELSSSQIISVRIKNLDDAPVSNFMVSYSINNGLPVVETDNTIVAAGATYTHNFSTPANLSAAGNYIFKAIVTKGGDANRGNDTATVLVKQIDNQPLNLNSSFVDNIETASQATYEKDTSGITGDERYDFSRSTPYGRLRTFINTGIANSGTKAFTLDVNRYLPTGNVSYLYGTFNLSNYTIASNDLRLDFQFLNHGQQPNANNRVWIRGSDTQPWIEVYKLDSTQADAGSYKKSTSIELSNWLAANGQNFSSSFQVRWGQFGTIAATDKQTGSGYTIDDIHLYPVFNDVQMVRIDSPTVNNCGLNNATQIKVSVRNAGNATLTNVPVRYRINNGAFVSEAIASIAPKATIQYTFNAGANLSAFGAYTIQTVADLGNDSFRENDTTSVRIYNEPVITSFPYLQNFESSDGNFYSGGKRSSWEYGTPNSRQINGAASGAKAWKTKLVGTYNNNELSYLYSPCFDVTGMTAPTLSFSVALDVEDCGTPLCDAAWVEYSADGNTWTKLGTAGAGTNWYNKSAEQVWSIQNYTYWHVAMQALPTGLSRLRLRFVMASDAGVSREGIAIDDIHVYDNTKGIYDGFNTSVLTQNVSGNNWIDFTAGGKLVASIKPNNQSLGNTAVQAYIYNGAVRYINDQYYHHRNITIKPANNATDSVSIRFYFLDTEADTLIKATGCATCNKPLSAYQLGVSKYTDSDKTMENGTIADDQNGFWNFIASPFVTKVPFDKGYYAEFKVADFSEFWLNAGGINNATPLPVKMMEFTATKQGNDVALVWRIASESNVVRYEIEVARGNDALQANSFSKIGEVASLGNTTATRQYNFTDTEADKFGARYYRLKISNADGSYRYSQVSAVLFGEAVLWQIYPNPSNGKYSLVFQLNSNQNVAARLYDAKGSLVKEYRTTATGFLQKLNVDISANNYATGIYLLRLETGNKEQVFKLYKQ